MAQASQAIRDASNHKYYGTIDQMPASEIFGITPPVMTAEVPTAPPAFDVNNVSGYEGTTVGDAGKYFPPPPDSFPYRESEPMPAQTNWNIPAISEDEAKEAFIEYAASKCCYSKAPARDLIFQDLLALNTYRYYLETFTESRSSLWKTIPYRGEPVDSAMYGAAPSPWDMRVEVPEIFKDNMIRIKVPHTSTVKGCPICGCSGRRPCTQCHCLTRKQCWVCNGTGSQFTNQKCSSCSGAGTTMCNACSGLGTTACTDCGGTGKLLTYIELQVEWKNNIFEYVVDERTGFPTKLFKAVKGKKLFVDEQYLVHPVISFPISAVNQASRNAIEQHQAQFGSTARIVRQRQTIELVFLTKVEYEWNRKSYSYYVYGNEHKVYVEDYPKKCGCTII
ncbi:protein SSUH2 homolog isoform X1 [Ahaetulla prasina]|uniref:protein SSUH2 homolog isoform X1 n=3 Tax=Ahaetulla prasina TaxID=499056 RepID=UPI002649A254|nr:protein SSUH2 homolog isoform X1 [Ahaetulla prasina]